ncbi:sensor histidine kinase [Streptomyces corynorhini]|uniref:histidine kinase n=1 Tax=Streptomyces corynorhini TaxID=2282652 RepID=A0A370B857_9ACTN|nr:sensor histidine kinase [Streptomyces corynorhini]RDG36013.1 sensor histidine kinase [Streptomyces corynorhini]
MEHRYTRPRGGGRARGGRFPRPYWARGGPVPAGPAWRPSLFLAVFVLVGTAFTARGQSDRMPLDLCARLLLLAGPVLLLWRHRHPVVCVFGVQATLLAYFALGYPYGPVFLTAAVAVFNAIVSGHRRAAWWAVGTLWAGHLVIAHWLYRWLPPPHDRAAPWAQELVAAALAVALCAAAEVVRVRREQWAGRAAERAAARKRRENEERMRIARELHDVLAHSISVINVQAGVGLALLDSDPEQARTALTTIKAASKEALGEVRQVLDTLRAPGAAPRTPAPGLDRLPELVEQAASAGLTVEVVREGEPAALPPGTDLAAFRIVQEALTNVVRHSGSRTARVVLGYAPGRLDLRVGDAGPATGDGAGGSGNGLVGMRERAAALGGTIEAGPRPDGGFGVHAALPLTAERSTTECRTTDHGPDTDHGPGDRTQNQKRETS